MDEVIVYITVEINPTESEGKVKSAVINLLDNASITITPFHKGITLNAKAKERDSLVKFRGLLRNDRIRDAARKALFHSIRGTSIVFCLNKQVAYAGHVSFSEETSESPLGPIKVTIETDNPKRLIEWLVEKSG